MDSGHGHRGRQMVSKRGTVNQDASHLIWIMNDNKSCGHDNNSLGSGDLMLLNFSCTCTIVIPGLYVVWMLIVDAVRHYIQLAAQILMWCCYLLLWSCVT